MLIRLGADRFSGPNRISEVIMISAFPPQSFLMAPGKKLNSEIPIGFPIASGAPALNAVVVGTRVPFFFANRIAIGASPFSGSTYVQASLVAVELWILTNRPERLVSL